MKKTSSTKKIWIDLDNSPHVLFFNPIINELKKKGYQVVVTARDYAQVIGLADLFKLDYIPVGRHYGKNTALKAIGLAIRSLQMMPLVMKEKPTLALSHGSRSQVILSKIMGIPAAMAFDYEHTQWLPFVRLDLAIVLDVLIKNGIKRDVKRMVGYPGIKEDVYAYDFEPDYSLCENLGINGKSVIATIRPPATAAHYHTEKSDLLFEAVINHIASQENTTMVILPRTRDQGDWIRERWVPFFNNGKIIIPDQVVNGLNLMWHSDMVISGGGTIIREAAALGVPAYSIFGGETGAVDQYLSETGRLILLSSVEDVNTKIDITRRHRPEKLAACVTNTLKAIVNEVATYIDGIN